MSNYTHIYQYLHSQGILIKENSNIPGNAIEIERKYCNIQPETLTALKQITSRQKRVVQNDRYYDTADYDLHAYGEYIRLRAETLSLQTEHAYTEYRLCYKRVIDQEYGNQYRYKRKKPITDTIATLRTLQACDLQEQATLTKVSDHYTVIDHGEPFYIAVDRITFPYSTEPHMYIEIEYAGERTDHIAILEHINHIAQRINLQQRESRNNLIISHAMQQE